MIGIIVLVESLWLVGVLVVFLTEPVDKALRLRHLLWLLFPVGIWRSLKHWWQNNRRLIALEDAENRPKEPPPREGIYR